MRVVSSASSTEVTVTLFRGAIGFTRRQLADGEALTVRLLGGDAAFGGLRSDSRIVREAPPRALVFAPIPGVSGDASRYRARRARARASTSPRSSPLNTSACSGMTNSQ